MEWYSYLRPATYFLRRTLAGRERRFILEIVNEAVCYNQGKFAEFNFTALEKHKVIKKCLSQGKPDPATIKNLLDGLHEYILTYIFDVCDKNYEYLKRYFYGSGRSFKDPRLCIKVCQGDNIVDIKFRDRGEYIVKPHSIELNTGFSKAYKSGKAFLINDIPGLAKEGSYENPRLKKVEAAKYSSKPLECLYRKIKPGYKDIEWMKCWRTTNDGVERDGLPDSDSAYKSTYIFPMTLIGANISHEFRKRFGVDALKDESRAIYGFLCIDHEERNYFEEKLDWKIGYVFADLISHYLITGIMLTSKSNTTEKAKLLCGYTKEARHVFESQQGGSLWVNT